MAKYKDFVNVPDGLVPYVYSPFVPSESVTADTEKESLLNLIFGVNPETGLPSSDVGRFINKKLAPEVLQFIKDNLMQDISSSKPAGVPAGVDDEVVLNLTRDSRETRSQYIERVQKFMFDEKTSIAEARQKIEQQREVLDNE